MALENLQSKEANEDRRSPFTLRAAAEVNRFFNAKSPEVTGKEHLKEIPTGKRVIVAVTHISDLDTSLAISALGNDLDLMVATQSTVLNRKQDPRGYVGLVAAGLNNFAEIDYRRTSTGFTSGLFNPQNFSNMADAMNGGKDVLIVAHNPSHTGTLTRGGYGAVYLSQIVKDAVILPVAVNVESKEQLIVGKNAWKSAVRNAGLLNRPDTQVVIGKPIEPQHIEGIERFNVLLEKQRERNKNKAAPTATEITEIQSDADEFHRLSLALRRQSDELKKVLAAMLPKEKRGPYADKEETGPTSGTSA